MVPTYRSLLIYYDPLQVSLPELQDGISALSVGDGETADEYRIVEIPTLYGGEHGPDLEFVARNARMTESEVIGLHSGTDYLVYTMGFSPGFPYLGGLNPQAEHTEAAISSHTHTRRLRRNRRNADRRVPGRESGRLAANRTVAAKTVRPLRQPADRNQRRRQSALRPTRRRDCLRRDRPAGTRRHIQSPRLSADPLSLRERAGVRVKTQ